MNYIFLNMMSTIQAENDRLPLIFKMGRNSQYKILTSYDTNVINIVLAVSLMRRSSIAFKCQRINQYFRLQYSYRILHSLCCGVLQISGLWHPIPVLPVFISGMFRASVKGFGLNISFPENISSATCIEYEQPRDG